MIKRKISLVIVLMMLISLMVPNFVFGASNDYGEHWASNTIKEWYANDYVSGYEDGSFKPNGQITRAEFMKMVNNKFNFTAKADLNFKDLNSGDWYYQEVQCAVKASYIIGYEDNTVRPINKITRQEAALIISRIKNLKESPSSVNIFTDVNKIASWSIGGVGAVAKAKYMIGYEDASFRPNNYITRAEALVTIGRAMENNPIVEEPVVVKPGGGTSGGGNGNSTQEYAVLSDLKISEGNINFSSSVTSYTAIVSTTSTSIAVTATAITGTSINVTVTGTGITSSAIIVTTSSAINGVNSVANVPLASSGDTIITITVSAVGYKDRVYIINLVKSNK